jgi:hypothetical protein
MRSIENTAPERPASARLLKALSRIVALALWRYATQRVLPEDASLKAAV